MYNIQSMINSDHFKKLDSQSRRFVLSEMAKGSHEGMFQRFSTHDGLAIFTNFQVVILEDVVRQEKLEHVYSYTTTGGGEIIKSVPEIKIYRKGIL